MPALSQEQVHPSLTDSRRQRAQGKLDRRPMFLAEEGVHSTSSARSLNTSSKNQDSHTTKSEQRLAEEKPTSVPVPIPDTGVSTLHSDSLPPPFRTTLIPFVSALAPISLAIPSVIPTTLSLVSTVKPVISTTPTLSHFVSQPTSASSSASSSSSPSVSLSSSNNGQPTATIHKLPVAVVTVLAVGSAFILIGLFIIMKACTRPTHRTRPKPSLPILDDPFVDDDDLYSITKDSPIFGGKERFSSQNTGIGTWTQYSEAKTADLPQLPLQATHEGNGHSADEADRGLNSFAPGKAIGENDFLFPRPPPSQSVPTTLVSNALSSAASRFSIARSVSVYPASPVCTTAGDGKNYTADGHPIMKRNSKIALRRSKSDMTEASKMSFYDGGVAYDGFDPVKSPQFLAHLAEVPSVPVGRTRIKSSYYTPGSYPRMSSLPSSTSTKTKVNDITEFDVHQLPPIRRTDSRKDRDTKALTSALGLVSPPMDTIPLSPVQTIYPDDSLSVVDVKSIQKRPIKKSAAGAPTSPVDTSTALGSLMLMDFGTTDRSLSSLAVRLGEPIESSCAKPGNGKVSLQPPRVPSPPPLPSLTQMGLEHSNPEAYAEYRSPTYSIFGLYGEDRKSRMSMHSRLG